jgi:transposase InsO family protein
MPWKECDRMSLREEFVSLATGEGANVSELCRRFGVSRKTGYKWLARFGEEGRAGLADRSRRPRRSPQKTEGWLERAVLRIRDANPCWGGRKIRRRLQDLGHGHVPAASTITEILRRDGRIDEEASRQAAPAQRFEHARPNDLWQMDFKGHFALSGGGRCHPLSVLDDHSRFAVALRACSNEQGSTVQAELTVVFRRYGLPRAMLMDNGSPWGSDEVHRHTPLTVWLMEQGIRISHGRPYHPQTQGKDERFHRTLQAELLRGREFWDLADCQAHFDPWRDVYNTQRPHEALELAVPASRYEVSLRPFVESPRQWDYGPTATTRKVYDQGVISFRGREYKVGRPFRGRRVGLRPLDQDGRYGVYFCRTKIHEIDLREG